MSRCNFRDRTPTAPPFRYKGRRPCRTGAAIRRPLAHDGDTKDDNSLWTQRAAELALSCAAAAAPARPAIERHARSKRAIPGVAPRAVQLAPRRAGEQWRAAARPPLQVRVQSPRAFHLAARPAPPPADAHPGRAAHVAGLRWHAEDGAALVALVSAAGDAVGGNGKEHQDDGQDLR